MNTLALLLAVPVVLSAASISPRPVTFSGQIAPIVFAQCANCHHAGEAAPFSLTSYEDVRKRGAMIAAVTQSRYMPPWHAAHGFGDFAGERRLTNRQIAIIGTWVKEGMPQGDPAKMPALPHFAEGWVLGKPDLVVRMPKAFPIPASGADIYRNFVLPLHLTEDKWVRALEFHPGTRSIVHHVIFSYDATGLLRVRDGFDGEPGFNAMSGTGSRKSGSLGAWVVGQTPSALPDGLASSLPKGSDLILQEHYHLTGKAEFEKSTVGIYFAPHAPERKLLAIQIPPSLGVGTHLDIPAGEKAYRIGGSFVLPVDAKAWAVGGHAHYLAKEMKEIAIEPDGTRVPLLWIPDWDFGWQDRYQFKNPLVLPKGTRLDATITYDNSADNPHQPSNPPKEVRWGETSMDEMGSMSLLVTAVRKEDEGTLQKAISAEQSKAMQIASKDGTLRRMGFVK